MTVLGRRCHTFFKYFDQLEWGCKQILNEKRMPFIAGAEAGFR